MADSWMHIISGWKEMAGVCTSDHSSNYLLKEQGISRLISFVTVLVLELGRNTGKT